MKEMTFNVGYKPEPLSLVEFVEYSLDGSDYGRGALESAEAKVENTANAFARLLNVLVNKNLLEKDDIKMIVLGYV